MHSSADIDALLAKLLESGVSPKYVARLASELQDHCADLEEEAKRLGVPTSDVTTDARQRLGGFDAIAREFARRPELKSWVYTSVWLRLVLRGVAAAYLVVTAPARSVVSGQDVLLRYAAATAAGASITTLILLTMTALLSPESSWTGKAGAALGAIAGAERPRARTTAAPGAPGPSSEIEADERTIEPSSPTSGAGNMLDAGAAEGVGITAQRVSSQAADDSVGEGAHSTTSAADRERPFRGRIPEVLTADSPTGATADARSAPSAPPPRVRLAATFTPPLALPSADDLAARVALHASFGRLPDGELRRIVEALPEYPSIAARRGLEGYVVVEYTVTRTGGVREVVIVESSSSLFDRPALEAASGLRYRPRVVDGTAVDVEGVRTVFRFEIEA